MSENEEQVPEEQSDTEPETEPETENENEPGEEIEGDEDDPSDTEIDEDDSGRPDGKDAAEELSEAFGHFKNAAGLLFKSATSDPNVRGAAKTAEKTFKKIGQSAEPLARQLAGELSKMTKTVVDTVEGAIDSTTKKGGSAEEEEEEE